MSDCEHSRLFSYDSTAREYQAPCPWCLADRIAQLQHSVEMAGERIIAMVLERDALKAALGKYAVHMERCSINGGCGFGPCNCGLEELRE